MESLTSAVSFDIFRIISHVFVWLRTLELTTFEQQRKYTIIREQYKYTITGRKQLPKKGRGHFEQRTSNKKAV